MRVLIGALIRLAILAYGLAEAAVHFVASWPI
jgi:hypothetical protein